MTRADYQTYRAAFRAFLEREGVKAVIPDFDDEPTEFSARPCDACRRPLAGRRQAATAYHAATTTVLQYQLCDDCCYYAEYGTLDDQTMRDIEREQP